MSFQDFKILDLGTGIGNQKIWIGNDKLFDRCQVNSKFKNRNSAICILAFFDLAI